MSYLYVTNERIKDELIKKQCNLIQSFDGITKTWIFEINPSLFNCADVDFKTFSQQEGCFISDTLKMIF